MPTITVVTSNPNKAAEIGSILIGTDIASTALEIPEIQSFSLEEIVKEKALHAYRKLQRPVLVDDVGFYLDVLKGFPGPFVKFWEKDVGYDLAFQIAEKFCNDRVTVRCGFGYADASRFLYAEGVVEGRIVSQRGGNGFGFDFYFIPDGYDQTYAEMGREEKNKISHRRKGIDAMREKLITEGYLTA